MMQISKNFESIMSRIELAAESANREVDEISILAVSKRHGVDAVREAVNAGLRAMGENYVQEALEKMPHCDSSVEWHFIGRIQSNKTRAIAGNFSWVQTVCTDRIARRLGEQRPGRLPPLNVCIQVCVDGDTTHGGVMPEEAAALCRAIEELPGLRLRGLMTIPMVAEDRDAQRIPFRALRELRDELVAAGHDLDTLSMGMTNDLEAAVLEGSTMLRIGTGLFGPRPV